MTRKMQTWTRLLTISVLLLVRSWNFVGSVRVAPAFHTASGFVLQNDRRKPQFPRMRSSSQSLINSNMRASKVGRSRELLLSQIPEEKEQKIAQEYPPSSPSSSMEEKLWSYVYNLQNSRKRKTKDTKAARSLAHFLRNYHSFEEKSKSATIRGNTLHEALERALTQALRLAGETGDYRLILKLIENAIQFAGDTQILRPRIFGEALNALSQTNANASKIKQIWSLVSFSTSGKQPHFLSDNLSAFELNIAVKALASRGKVRSCIDLYHRHTDKNFAHKNQLAYIQPDAYTASTLFGLLNQSIQPKRDFSDDGRTMKNKLFQPIGKVGRRSVGNSFYILLAKLSDSPCWQWNAALEIIASLPKAFQWNNHVYSSLLKLQDTAQELVRGHKNGPQIAVAILDSMIQQGVKPDLVTCTLAIKAMGDPTSDENSWQMAVQFLQQLKDDTRLPQPNEYCYSAAIVACARCGEHKTALELLEEMRQGRNNFDGSKDKKWTGLLSDFVPPHPNTFVYNAALAAIAKPDLKPSLSSQQRKSSVLSESNQWTLALQLLDQMKDDCRRLGMDTAPDTCTYNTILAISTLTHGKESGAERGFKEVIPLLNEMREQSIPRDGTTYTNAILGCAEGTTILILLQAAVEDLGGSVAARERHLTPTFNSALAALSSQNNLKRFKEALVRMQEVRCPLTSETLVHLFNVLARTGKSVMLLSLLTILQDDDEDKKNDEVISDVIDETGLNVNHQPKLQLTPIHYAAPIETYLVANELEKAREILGLMREHGVAPTMECLQTFSWAYARGALKLAPKGFKEGNEEARSIATSRAENSFTIAMSLRDPSIEVLSKVAQACAATSQWTSAQAILRSVHRKLLDPEFHMNRKDVEMLRGMHTSIMRECAKQGNVTAALGYANDIQNFGKLFRSSDDGMKDEALPTTEHFTEANFLAPLKEFHSVPPKQIFGMRARDWVFLIKAASKSGHWRVCVNTLQFLRPYLEKTNPKNAKGVDDGISLDARYEQVAPALTATSDCLEKRSQYAWAIRVVDEWMEWSGRKPRPEAVLSGIRVLANRGRGEEAKSLLMRCVEEEPLVKYTKKGVRYEEMLYLGAITALHNNGMYDDADEIFISAISQEHLPFVFGKDSSENKVYILDLHGMNVAMAHSAVRVAMRRLTAETDGLEPHDMMIITGRGRNSSLRMRPVLRPEVQRMLLEEFYPPLNTVSVPGNTGALTVYGGDISAWQAHQREQKGARMLTLAALLKNVSSDRLQTIALKLGGGTLEK